MTKSGFSPMARILLFVVGMALAVFLMLWVVNWNDLPFQFVVSGQVVTPYFMASLVVIAGILATTLIKSGILGKWKLD